MEAERPFDAACPLCEAARITPWFHEDDTCWIAECEICATPMVVWRGHGVDPPPDERGHMLAHLTRVASEHLGPHWVDGNMRNIPDHFHAHARPEGGFFGPGAARTASSAGEHPARPGGRTMVRIPVDGPDVNVYEAVGGRPFFDDLAARFYAAVETDPVLRPLYPEDLSDSVRNTAGFLAQYWGGGTAQYSDERGHPRLRMRHGHVTIGMAQRDAWLGHMLDAVRASRLAPDIEQRFVDYFTMATTHLVNASE